MKILVLTEGGRKKGFGHVYFTRDQGIKPIMMDWINNRKKALEMAALSDVVILDSYKAPYTFYLDLFNLLGKRLLVLDDFKRIHYPPCTVVNPSISGDAFNYSSNSFPGMPACLCGKNYSIVRRDFWDVPVKDIKKKIRNVLLTFGGTAQMDTVKGLIQFLLSRYPDFRCHIVMNRPDRKPLFNSDRLKIYSSISSKDMLEVMNLCDLAISAGGQTVHELACSGIPVIGVCLADNQKENLKAGAKTGYLKFAGNVYDSNMNNKINKAVVYYMPQHTRKKHSKISKRLVDGKGALRVAEYIIKLVREAQARNNIHIRQAGRTDCRDIWKWRNHPKIRKMSLTRSKIPYSVHVQWFIRKIKDNRSVIYIAENERKQKIGQVRFEINRKNNAVINVNLNPEFLGKGYGSNIIRTATGIFLRRRNRIKGVDALIAPENHASKNAFQKADYRYLRIVNSGNKMMHLYKYKRQS